MAVGSRAFNQVQAGLWEKRRDTAADEEVRPEAVYIYGTDKMSTDEILRYFAGAGEGGAHPTCAEWIDDSSAVVIFASGADAAAALLSRTEVRLHSHLHSRRHPPRSPTPFTPLLTPFITHLITPPPLPSPFLQLLVSQAPDGSAADDECVTSTHARPLLFFSPSLFMHTPYPHFPFPPLVYSSWSLKLRMGAPPQMDATSTRGARPHPTELRRAKGCRCE